MSHLRVTAHETTLASLLLDANITNCSCSDIETQDYTPAYGTFNLVIVIIFMPVVASFGVYSNLVNCFIYTRPLMREDSQNIFLTALSTSDLFVVLTGMFMFWIDSASSHLPALKDVMLDAAPTVLPCGYIAQTCSVYFTVAAAVDCYLKTCCSIRARPVRVWQSVAVIAVVSIGYNAIRFKQFEEKVCVHDGVPRRELCTTEFYEPATQIYNVHMYTALMVVLPFVTLGLLNALIVRKLRRKREAKEREAGGHLSPPPASEAEADGGAITMIMVVVLFLSCNTLALIINFVELAQADGDPDALLVLHYLTDTSNFLIIVNSSINIIIYIVFSKEYRQYCLTLCCCSCRRVQSDLLVEDVTRGAISPSNDNERATTNNVQNLYSNPLCSNVVAARKKPFALESLLFPTNNSVITLSQTKCMILSNPNASSIASPMSNGNLSSAGTLSPTQSHRRHSYSASDSDSFSYIFK